MSGWAASTLGPQTGQFARVSIGGGAWVSAISAYALVLASRRLLGRRSVVGVLIGVLAPAAIVALLLSGYLDDLGIMKEYANVSDRFWVETVNTIIYAAVSVSIAAAVGVFLGIQAFRNQHLERPIFATVSVFQTIPGLAMVGLLVTPFAAVSFAWPFLRTLGIGGIGWAPVVTALTLYALLAIVRNTYAGLRNVPPAVVDAGRGMGMTDGQLMRKVELPLGMPVVFSGVQDLDRADDRQRDTRRVRGRDHAGPLHLPGTCRAVSRPDHARLDRARAHRGAAWTAPCASSSAARFGPTLREAKGTCRDQLRARHQELRGCPASCGRRPVARDT